MCFVFVVIIGSMLLVNNFHVYKTAFAGAKKTKFNGADFKINNFGIDKGGFPFIDVEGTPGGSVPQKEIRDMLMCLKQIREPSRFHRIGCTRSDIHTK